MMALALITGTIWFGISFGSPCAPLPSPEERDSLYPQPLPSNIVVFIGYDSFPQLWCAPGEYSLFGQVSSCCFHWFWIGFDFVSVILPGAETSQRQESASRVSAGHRSPRQNIACLVEQDKL